MHAAIAAPGNSRTILTHLFGRGLEDDRYRVERFQAMADGDIRRWPGDKPATRKGRRKAGCTIASLKAVRALRPARTEIIVCTGCASRAVSSCGATSRRACSANAGSADGVLRGRPRRPRAGRASPAWIQS